MDKMGERRMMNYMEVLTDKQMAGLEKQFEELSSGVQEILPVGEFKAKLAKSIALGKPLKVKLGLDPSAPDVHLGHTVVLNKLQRFQAYGHRIQLIIGDFTGKIGDPTGKSEVRKQLTDEEVKRNAETYFKQFSKVLNMDAVELHYNSSWLSELNFEDIVRLAGKITVARMLERDDFEKRLGAGKPVSLHEFFYPLMQGYDSVVLESDIELGGTDQHFNVLMGRHLQEHYGKEKQVVITMPLLEGLDGVEKMSKSKANYIGIDDTPADMYGKTMSIPDELMVKYFKLLTNLPVEKINEIERFLNDGCLHPRDAKMQLGRVLVSMYHDHTAAEQAERTFKSVFQKGILPETIPSVSWEGPLQTGILDLLVELKLQTSKNEARKMIKNGGIRLNGKKVADDNLLVTIEDGLVVQVGKRKFVELKANQIK